MATIERRLATLEQMQREARPPLIIFEQGELTPSQREQIALAKRQGREVSVVQVICAEDLTPEEIAEINMRR